MIVDESSCYTVRANPLTRVQPATQDYIPCGVGFTAPSTSATRWGAFRPMCVEHALWNVRDPVENDVCPAVKTSFAFVLMVHTTFPTPACK